MADETKQKEDPQDMVDQGGPDPAATAGYGAAGDRRQGTKAPGQDPASADTLKGHNRPADIAEDEDEGKVVDIGRGQ